MNMADEQAIATLRAMIDEASPDSTYVDDVLSSRIDEADGKLDVVAASVWREKAASYSGLVDIQEGSSRRSLGSLQGLALNMATRYEALVAAAAVPVTAHSSRTRQITRP
jgi:hypothetical protein